MPNINKATIFGYLGQDPDIKHTQNGDAVTNLSIATTDKWKDKETANDEIDRLHHVNGNLFDAVEIRDNQICVPKEQLAV